MRHCKHSLLVLLLTLVSSASSLKVVIDSNKDGTFDIVHGAKNETLFRGGKLSIFVGGAWCVADESLPHRLFPVDNLLRKRGHDDTLGPFTAFVQRWMCGFIRIITTIQNFDSDANVVFQISYPDGAWGTSTVNHVNGSWTSSMAHFPILESTTLPSALSWQGTFMNPIQSVSQGPNGGPIVFYNESDVSLSTVIVASVWNGNWKAFSSGDGLDWNGRKVLWAPGTSGRIQRLPKGYQQSVLLHASSGITNAIFEWGRLLQQSRPTKGNKIDDVTLNKIGYQTDNGAYYCFCNEPNCSKTLINEINYLKSIGIPMGYLSFQGAGASSGRGTAAPWCVDTWGIDGGLSDRYPVSVKDMQHAIGIPLQLYAPYFCPHSPYFNETSKWAKVSSNTSFPSCAGFDFEDVLPKQSRAFYDELFDRGIAAGMKSYESDFMNQNYNCVPEFVTTTSAVQMWQKGMADAAKARNIPIQWCMATPSDVLASVDMPSVTNFRVSGDFCYGDSWDIGISSLLVWALGAAPSKDTLWTSTNHRTAIPGCKWTPDHELPAIELHVILALMSTGPMGISDAIGMTNATMLRRTITANGTLLKPSKPITAVDSSLLSTTLSGLEGYVYSTSGYSDRSWHFISFKMKKSYAVRLRDFWPPIVSAASNAIIPLVYRSFHHSSSCKHGTYAVASGCVTRVLLNDTADPSTIIFVTPKSSFENVTGGSDFAPTLTTVWKGCYPKNDWTLLGELDKYVPLSPARFLWIVCTERGVVLNLRGSVGEEITLTYIDPQLKIFVHKVVINGSGEATLSVETQGGKIVARTMIE